MYCGASVVSGPCISRVGLVSATHLDVPPALGCYATRKAVARGISIGRSSLYLARALHHEVSPPGSIGYDEVNGRLPTSPKGHAEAIAGSAKGSRAPGAHRLPSLSQLGGAALSGEAASLAPAPDTAMIQSASTLRCTAWDWRQAPSVQGFPVTFGVRGGSVGSGEIPPYVKYQTRFSY